MRLRFSPTQPIIVRADLSGPDGLSRSVRLLLDTGARQTMISPVRLEQAGIEISKEVRHITTASAVEALPIAWVSQLKVEEHSRIDLPVIAHRIPGVSQIDGLLGMDFLAGLHLSIRMRQGVLTLEEDSDAL